MKTTTESAEVIVYRKIAIPYEACWTLRKYNEEAYAKIWCAEDYKVGALVAPSDAFLPLPDDSKVYIAIDTIVTASEVMVISSDAPTWMHEEFFKGKLPEELLDDLLGEE